VTYSVRVRLSTTLPEFFDECGVAANIFWVPLTISFFVFGPGSIGFLLLLVYAPIVIRMK
jgi:hypothetical protein